MARLMKPPGGVGVAHPEMPKFCEKAGCVPAEPAPPEAPTFEIEISYAASVTWPSLQGWKYRITWTEGGEPKEWTSLMNRYDSREEAVRAAKAYCDATAKAMRPTERISYTPEVA
ncbi:hypothetical protein [Streptomyces sp. NPDC015131]|uniref:hypothetical protein n=1 Tax=Streptomyces sp. NPDC015131 TaxID=3364941 RepID=UPI0036F9A108